MASTGSRRMSSSGGLLAAIASSSTGGGPGVEQLPNKSIAEAQRNSNGDKSTISMADNKKRNRGLDGVVSPVDCPFSDAVNRIVLAAEGRQLHTASNACGSVVEGSDVDSTSHEAKTKSIRITPSRQKSSRHNDGPLTDQELSHLGMLCSSSTNRNLQGCYRRNTVKGVEFSWNSVDADQLESLIAMLEIHVNSATNVDVVSRAVKILTSNSDEDNDDNECFGMEQLSIEQWLSAKGSKEDSNAVGSGDRLLTTLRRGLESASIILSIMTCCNDSNGNSRRCLNEDTLEACLALLKQHLIKNIIPSLSEAIPAPITAQNIANKERPPAKKRKGNKADKENPEANEAISATEARNQKDSKDKNKASMRKVYKLILSTHGLLMLLMERCEALIQSVIHLDDKPILAITTSVLTIFTVDPPVTSSSENNVASVTHGIQVVAIRLITSLVRRYPRHRVIVMEDLFPLLLKLPTSKRSLRTFPLRFAKCSSLPSSRYRRNSSLDSNTAMSPVTIQVTTALILSIIQSFVVMPQLEQDDEEPARSAPESTKKAKVPQLEQAKEPARSASRSAKKAKASQLEQTEEELARSAKKAKVLQLVTKYTSGLVECNSACSFFATQLVIRCAKKGQDGGASEFRPYLANLVDDLLLVQVFPEFPAAESLLMAFCRKLSSDLLCCKQEGTPSFEVSYMTIAVETLGKICAATAGHLRYNRENPLALPRVDSSIEESKPINSNSAPINNEEEINRCFCERINLVDTYMIDCDRCHGWFHASCVGIAVDEVPSCWVCDDCKIQIIVIEQIEVISAAIGRPGTQKRVLDEILIFRQLLLNHLTSKNLAGIIPDAMVAREFLLAKWIDQAQPNEEHRARKDGQNSDELDSETMRSYFLNQWISATPCQIHSSESQRTASAERWQLSDEGNTRVVRALIAKSSELASSFPNQLGVIVKLMGDESVNSLRKLAVKAIAQVVQVDPSLMLQISLRQAVARRFLDEAISVREAAVSLVGCYVLQDPKVASAFHSSLIARLGDVGVSVKRRVVRIFRDLLTAQPEYSGRVEVCSSMLQRAANPREEEGLRADIKTMFKELWFDEESLNRSANGASLTSGITEGSPLNDVTPDAKFKKQRFRDVVKQMVDVITASSDTGFLESMVKELYSVSEDGRDNNVQKGIEGKAETEDFCSNLVSAIFEELLQFEEARCRNSQRNGDSRLVSIMIIIGIFCEVVPGLFAQHLDTLLPYLKADNFVSVDDEAKILTIICRLIVKLVSSALPYADVQRLVSGSAADDLGKITHKFGSVASAAAVEALATIARRMGSNGDQRAEQCLMKLATTFYGYLYKVKDMTNDYSTTTAGVQSNLKRALSVLQAICQHHISNQNSLSADADLATDDDPTTLPYLQPSLLSSSNLLDASFAAFYFYLGKNDITIKCAALTAMSGIFLARPRIMLAVEKKGVFADLFSKNMPPSVQLEALRCWKNILSSEEWRVESGQAREKMNQNADVTLSKRISGDQDGDSSIAGSVLTQHTKRIYQLVKSSYAAIRLAAVDLVGLLLRQGLINPLETVPHLLALQGDVQNPAIRVLALQLLVREGEKRPDMLRQRICAGVKEAYLFQRAIIPDGGHITAVTFEAEGSTPKVECIFGLLYKECLRSSKVAKQALFTTLIRIFVSFDAGDENSNDTFRDVGVKVTVAKKSKQIEPSNSGSMISPRATLDLPFLCYVSQILAHLPYNASMDPLYIIYHVSHNITIHGEQLLFRFAQFLSPHFATFSKGEDRECEDLNHERDLIEEAAKSKAPSRTKAAKLFDIPDFDLDFFAYLCSRAFSIILLIRLQQFLKKVYSLSETRCFEYNPNGKEKVSDRNINIPEEMPVFNNKFEPCVQDTFCRLGQSSVATKKEAVMHVYAEFRYLMRTAVLPSMEDKASKEQ